MAGFQERLAEAAPETLVHVIAQDREQAFIFLIHLTGHPEVEKTLKECNWTALSVPENLRTPRPSVYPVGGSNGRLRGGKAADPGQVENVLAERPRLMAYYDNWPSGGTGCLSPAISAVPARPSYYRLGPGGRCKPSGKELNQVSKTATLIVTEPEEEVYPVALKNSPGGALRGRHQSLQHPQP